MKEAIADECPAEVIKRKCRAMVDYGRTFGWMGPPFCPKSLAGLHGIIVEETHTPMDGEGQILPRKGKTVIQYKAGILPQRQRFTICHELAHTCFPDVFEFVRSRGAESDEDKAHRQFENLCHAGAGELLMPFPEFHHEAVGHIFDGKLVHMLAAKFDASLDATIKRLIDCAPEPCAAAFLTDQAFSNFRAWEGRNRVVWYWHNETMKGYLATPGYVTIIDEAMSPISLKPKFKVARDFRLSPHISQFTPTKPSRIDSTRSSTSIFSLVNRVLFPLLTRKKLRRRHSSSMGTACN